MSEKYIKDLEERIEELETKLEANSFSLASLNGLEIKLKAISDNRVLFEKMNKDLHEYYKNGKLDAYKEILEYIGQLKAVNKKEK